MATRVDILHGYRHLYRGLLRAVQYAKPARFTARDRIRAAFREPGGEWDSEGAKRTLWFLEAAARERGLEHKILRNLLKVPLFRSKAVRAWKKNLHDSKKRDEVKVEDDFVFQHYEMTVAMLNKSMGLCLR